MAERRLENGVMYRLDRHDVAKAVPANASLDELLAFCETHLLRVAAREGEFQLSGDGQRALDQQDIVAEDAGVRFGTGWSPVQCSEGLRYRWLESESELRFEQPAGDARELLLTAEVGPSAGREPVTLEIRNQAGSTLAAVAVTDRCQLRIQMPSGFSENALILRVHGADLPITRQPRIANLRVLALKWDTPPGRKRCAGWSIEVLDTGPAFDWAGSFDAASPFSQEIRNAAHLHISACGDFTLLSRENWFRLRAYPEFPIWPMHIDALLCYTAYHAGIRESILREPMRIYHVEHGSGAGWTPEGEQERIARVKSKGVSELTYAGFAKWVDLMRRYDSPVICNGGNWGLGDVDLFEQTVWR
ncbi:MAG TPA: hypothetical protein VKX49_00435 [Bryobacteraceae bacterium]|nr:hypothetical protein [Bryobacteraceae bacterium]